MTNNVHTVDSSISQRCAAELIEVFHNVALRWHQEKMTHTVTERDKKVVLHNILQKSMLRKVFKGK